MYLSLLAFLAGITVSLKTSGIVYIALFAAVSIIISFITKKFSLAVLLAAGVLLGSLSKWADTPQLTPGEKGFIVRKFRVTGFPVLREDGRYEIRCGNVKIISAECKNLYRTETVRVAGTASVSEFNSRFFIQVFAKEITVLDGGFTPFRLVSRLREWINGRIALAGREDVRSLLYAMITGNTNFIGYSVKETFRMTGVTHLLAISGLNVAIIGIALFFLFRKTAGEKTAIIISCGAVVLYVFAAGFGASLLRAGIMFTLYQLLKYSGRKPDPLDVAAVSVFPVLAFDATLLFETGFWLSYGAVLGILLLSSGLRKLIRLPGAAGESVSETLAVTLSANFATLPVLVFVFGGISLAAPLANLIIIPVFNVLTVVLFAEFASLAAGIPFLPAIQETALSVLWSFCVTVSDILSYLPGGYLTLTPDQAVIAIALCGTAGAGIFFLPGFVYRRRLGKLRVLHAKSAFSDRNDGDLMGK